MSHSLMNAKNKLQELFQKKQLPLPIYSPIRSGGTDHRPLWISIVKLYDGREFYSDEYANKSQADMSAASKALNAFKELDSLKKLDSLNDQTIAAMNVSMNDIVKELKSINNTGITTDVNGGRASIYITSNQITKSTQLMGKTAILVDVENLPKFIDAISHRLNEFTVYAFIGEHHCLIDKELSDEIIKIISPSTRADGTDTCMQVYVGMLLTKEVYDNYFIATRDHYGSALVEMIMAPNLGWKSKFARLITNPAQI